MLAIEYVPISTIKPYAGNAKRHPAEQVEQIVVVHGADLIKTLQTRRERLTRWYTTS